jgi:uncharacterized protein YhbP (UPF0306 family)
MESKKLSDSWAELNSMIVDTPIVSPEDLRSIATKLLEVLSLISNEKVRLTAFLKKQTRVEAEQFSKDVHSATVKGMAFEERRLYRELRLSREVYDAKRRLDVLQVMAEACKSYELSLRLVNNALNLDAKLSFEGHN